MNVATSICPCRFASAAARFPPIRFAVAWLVPCACSPVHSRAWYADHAVPTVASARSTVAASSSSRSFFASTLVSMKVGADGARSAMCHDPFVIAAEPIRESRWPPVAALLVYMMLNIAVRIWLPGDSAIRAPWLVPAVEAVLLAVLLFGDPGRLARRSPWVRRIVLAIGVNLFAAAVWGTTLVAVKLIKGIRGNPTT